MSSELDPEFQKLLRLKRYEKPADDFTETFLADLKDRQRKDLMHQSTLRIAAERAAASVTGSFVQRRSVLIGAGFACLGLIASWAILTPKNDPSIAGETSLDRQLADLRKEEAATPSEVKPSWANNSGFVHASMRGEYREL